MKRILASIMCLAMICLTTAAAFAEPVNPAPAAVAVEGLDMLNDGRSYDDVLYEQRTRGSNPPSSEWEFKTDAYKGYIDGLRYGPLYTNYYFSGVDTEIYVRSDLDYDYSDQSGALYDIVCYDKSTNKEVTRYEDISPGENKIIKFYNLDSSKYYYFGWVKTKNNTISGNIYVHNTNWLY